MSQLKTVKELIFDFNGLKVVEFRGDYLRTIDHQFVLKKDKTGLWKAYGVLYTPEEDELSPFFFRRMASSEKTIATTLGLEIY